MTRKTGIALTIWLSIATTQMQAQDATTHKLELATSVQAFNTTDQPMTGVQVRQQIAVFPTKCIGVALGIGLGVQSSSPTNDHGSNIATLKSIYDRNIVQSDIGLILRPVATRRHVLSLSIGIAALRHITTRVDCVFVQTYPSDPKSEVYVKPRISDGRTVALVAGASYQFRVSPRFGLGLDGRLTWGPGGQRISSVGLSGSYRFNVSAASLGLPPIAADELTWGVRAAANISGQYERSVGELWLTRVAAGFWAQVPLSVSWAMRGELAYVQRGYDIAKTVQAGYTILPASSRANYIDATLLFRNELSERWHLFVGPHLSFFLNGMYQSNGTAYPVNTGINSGLTLGTSVNLTQRIALDARYVRDIIRFGSEPYGGFQGFQLGTSIRLNK